MPPTPAWLDPYNMEFPHPSAALTEPNGLLAVGGDLAPERLIRAYRQGIFPWYEDPQPILWWSPNPRAILYPGQIHVSRSLRKILRSGRFRATIDQRFPQVIENCARLRKHREGTWITQDMHAAFIRLHELGYAHSVEIYQGERLQGGLYGLGLGQVFFGESMFSLQPNASKVALFVLDRVLRERGFHLIDCQVESEHLISMGAIELARDRFLDVLKHHAQAPDPLGPWQ